MEFIDTTVTGKDYFSPSQLKALAKGADEYQVYLDKTYYQNKGMALGTLLHTLILEPEEFDKRYAVLDDTDKVKELLEAMPVEKRAKAKPRATAAYKKFAAEFASSAGRRGIVQKELFDEATMIVDKLKISGIYDTFFTGGKAERTLTKTVSFGERKFNALCIADYELPHTIVDLKTSSEKDFNKLIWSAKSFGYDVQAVLSSKIADKPFVFIYVQTVSPYKIAVHTPSGLFLQGGEGKIEQALDNFEHWKYSDIQVMELNF